MKKRTNRPFPKQVIFLIGFLAIPISIFSQKPITSSSTAEQCIAYIESTANTRLADDNYTYSFSFNGTTFKEINESKDGSRNIIESKNVDWSKFSLFVALNEEDDLIDLVISFNSKFMVIEELSTKEYGIFSREVDYAKYLHILISKEQAYKIPEFEKAVKRLAKLATSKSSPILNLKIPPGGFEYLPSSSETEASILSLLSNDNVNKQNQQANFSFDEFEWMINVNWDSNNNATEKASIQNADLKKIEALYDFVWVN